MMATVNSLPRDLGVTPFRSYSAVLADVDGDGFLDVIVGNDVPDPKLIYPDIIVANRYAHTRGSNYVCLNRGGGNFDTHCRAFSHESATTIAPADFSGHGFIDLAVANRDGGQSYLYVNEGKANFSKRVPFGPAHATIRVAVAADLTGNGRNDIVAIDEQRGAIIFFNQGDGTFSAARPLGTVRATPYALAAGNLRRDGKVDIVVGYINAPSVAYFNDGSGRNFVPVPFGDGQGAAYGIAIGDLDQDGWPDIAIARSGAPSTVYFSSGVPQCEK